MKTYFKIITVCFVCFIGSWNSLHAQLYTVDIPVSYDSYTDSENPSTNYGSDTTMRTGAFASGGNAYYNRTFLYFDMSLIPSGANVSNAQIKMKKSSGSVWSQDWDVIRVTSTWDESTITHANQPSISSGADYGYWSNNPSGDEVNFFVGSMARDIHWGLKDNYGFVIEALNETDTTGNNLTLYSGECINSANRPVLRVEYYYPIQLQNVSINHESATAAGDGSISFGISGGTDNFSYSWTNSSGTVISTDSILDSLNYGWYGVHITGSGGDELYQAFLIGVDCDVVDVTFTAEPEFTRFAYTIDEVINGIDYPKKNFGNARQMLARDWSASSGWYETVSFLDFDLWMDDQIVINKADLTLNGWNHYVSNWKTNESELIQVTEYWEEEAISFSTQPNASSLIWEEVPAVTTSTQAATVDLTDFWNSWKVDNNANYGLKFQLQNPDHTFIIRQFYHSPNTATASNRPYIEFTLDLTDNNGCPIAPCQIGDIVSSNGTWPVEYSPCDVPSMSVNPALYYEWTPQVGLTCYDCPNPSLLLADIVANNIPAFYTLKAYSSELNRERDRPCDETTVQMVKKYCAEDCNYTVTSDPANFTGLCEGDIVAFNVTGPDTYVWSANTPGLNCTTCNDPFFTVQSTPSQVYLQVLNAQSELCGEYWADIIPDPNCMAIEGVSYNNYGVNTYVYNGTSAIETHLNIYGNVINELIVNSGGATVNGTFINEGTIAVTKDWINNSLNDFFVTASSFGDERLIGSYQRIRGVSPTKYYNLFLEGQGVKEMFVDAHALNSMDLTMNELSTRDNVMYVENTDPTIITRTNGFVSSNLLGGGLSREMLLGTQYEYPLGSSVGTLRFRPIEIRPAIDDAVTARLVNYDAAYDNMIDLAPDVQSVNDLFYHQITPVTGSSEDITFHYVESTDGSYQHVAQYAEQYPTDFWQKTGSIVLGTSSYFPNTDFVTTTWDEFTSINYVLANAGFVIDLDDFGVTDPNGGGTGVTTTVTSNGGSSTGGGLGGSVPAGGGTPSTGGTTYTPTPVAGIYTITVSGACIETGNIIFEVDGAGNIVPLSLYFASGSVQLPLAESLYELQSTIPPGINTGILDINSIPESVFAECTDDVTITLTDGLTLDIGDDFIVNTPGGLTVDAITILDATGSVVGSSASNSWTCTASSGLHYYEVIINDGVTTITLTGQFIVAI